MGNLCCARQDFVHKKAQSSIAQRASVPDFAVAAALFQALIRIDTSPVLFVTNSFIEYDMIKIEGIGVKKWVEYK
jgi:hypothetical protein